MGPKVHIVTHPEKFVAVGHSMTATQQEGRGKRHLLADSQEGTAPSLVAVRPPQKMRRCRPEVQASLD